MRRKDPDEDEKSYDFIKEWRLAMGWTQKELSQRCGVKQSSISRYESGEYIADLRALVQIASGFGLPYSALLISPPKSMTEILKYLPESEHELVLDLIRAILTADFVGLEKRPT